MEPVGAFSNEELHCFSRMFSNVDTDFMLQLHDQDIFSNDSGNGMGFETPCFFSTSAANHNVAMADQGLFSSSDTFNTNDCPYISQESSNSSGSDNVYFPNPSIEEHQVNFLHLTNDIPESMEFYVMDNKSANTMVPVFTDDAMDDILSVKELANHKSGNADPQAMAIVASGNQQQFKRKSDSLEDSLSNDSSDNPKKKSRVSRDTQTTRNNTQSRKNKKIPQDSKNENENETNGGQNMQSSSPSMSEDDSNASQEISRATNSDSKGSAVLNSNGKQRASRGSATDSQSLYARRRRERINERLKILQNLVPNGTKVDISTMLEEAVQYVRFLQLQVKLLSSDDLWMYAPIAYNGMDIGSYQKIFPYL